jgi:hypothetical protein
LGCPAAISLTLPVFNDTDDPFLILSRPLAALIQPLTQRDAEFACCLLHPDAMGDVLSKATASKSVVGALSITALPHGRNRVPAKA